jgi:hypothetical protein
MNFGQELNLIWILVVWNKFEITWKKENDFIFESGSWAASGSRTNTLRSVAWPSYADLAWVGLGPDHECYRLPGEPGEAMTQLLVAPTARGFKRQQPGHERVWPRRQQHWGRWWLCHSCHASDKVPCGATRRTRQRWLTCFAGWRGGKPHRAGWPRQVLAEERGYDTGAHRQVRLLELNGRAPPHCREALGPAPREEGALSEDVDVRYPTKR